MKFYAGFLAVAILASLSGCTSCEVKAAGEPACLETEGFASGYLALNGIRPYDKRLFYIGILKEWRDEFEVVTLDVWPLVGVGVGLAGVRVQVLPLEVAVGVLAYHPKPRSSEKAEPEEKKAKESD